jgi:hypothetical protein
MGAISKKQLSLHDARARGDCAINHTISSEPDASLPAAAEPGDARRSAAPPTSIEVAGSGVLRLTTLIGLIAAAALATFGAVAASPAIWTMAAVLALVALTVRSFVAERPSSVGRAEPWLGGRQLEHPLFPRSDPSRGSLQGPARVTVVIPARNEAANLPYVLNRLPAGLFEVILVDGDSTDGTADVARALYPGIRLVGQNGRGKGNALMCGFKQSRGDIIVMLDADGSTDPAEISRFVNALLDGADLAKGSRFLQGAGSSDITFLRTLGNSVLRTIVNRMFGTRYSDLCYGYAAFWADCLHRLELDCDGFEVETLMNIRAARHGLRIAEVPSFESPRIHGSSNLRVTRDGLRIVRTIARERLSARTVAPPPVLAVPAPNLGVAQS